MISVDVALKRVAFHLDVAFENESGITALFGRSGSGKSTVIHLIAGLARPDRGTIVLDGRTLVDIAEHIYLASWRRRVGLVFQDAQLLPHLSVKQNLLYGRWFAPRLERSIAFTPVVETLGIGHLLKRKPASLSGGEKQRVAIGRALLSSPQILLMDEPLASLDAERKHEILPLIERLRDEFKLPVVYVSHIVEEVARLAAKVVVLDNGHVAAIGSVEEVFGPGLRQTSLSRFARSSVITGRIAGIDPAYGLTEFAHPAGTVWLTGRAGPVGTEARIVIKSTDITLSKARVADLSARTTLTGKVSAIENEPDGALAGVSIALDGQGQLFALATRKAVEELGLAPGDRVFALIKTVALDERAVAASEP